MLQKNPALKKKIIEGLTYQVENDFFKTKYATRRKWHDMPVLECRINDLSVGAVRIAFARRNDEIHVLFGSTTLLKNPLPRNLRRF